MTDILNYLSGNVPGGIGLYACLVIVIFLVLFGISRRNDLIRNIGNLQRQFFDL